MTNEPLPNELRSLTERFEKANEEIHQAREKVQQHLHSVKELEEKIAHLQEDAAKAMLGISTISTSYVEGHREAYIKTHPMKQRTVRNFVDLGRVLKTNFYHGISICEKPVEWFMVMEKKEVSRSDIHLHLRSLGMNDKTAMKYSSAYMAYLIDIGWEKDEKGVVSPPSRGWTVPLHKLTELEKTVILTTLKKVEAAT